MQEALDLGSGTEPLVLLRRHSRTLGRLRDVSRVAEEGEHECVDLVGAFEAG